MGFFKFIKNLFGGKKESSDCCEPSVESPSIVEKPEVEKITERLIDVSSKPLTRIDSVEEPSTSVKEIKSKSRKKETKVEVETPKPKKVVKKTPPKKEK